MAKSLSPDSENTLVGAERLSFAGEIVEDERLVVGFIGCFELVLE